MYDLRTLMLQKIMTQASAHITALAWESFRERYLAQATLDKRLTVWDTETEQVKFEVQLNSHPIYIEWNIMNNESLFVVQSNGELKSIDLNSKLVQQVTFEVPGNPTTAKICPDRKEIVTVGLDTGSLVFYNQETQETIPFDAYDSANRLEEKRKTYLQGLTPFERAAVA